jgi:hypothetical protein
MIAGHRNRGGFYCIAAMRRHRNRNLLFLCDVLVNTQFCKQTHGLVYAALSVSPLLSRYTAGSGGLALASLMYCVYCIIFRCSFDLDPRKSKLEPISPYFFFVLHKKKNRYPSLFVSKHKIRASSDPQLVIIQRAQCFSPPPSCSKPWTEL